MRKFKTVSFAVSPELNDCLADFFSRINVSKSEWFRGVIARALAEQGINVDDPEKHKGLGRGRRTDLTDPERRKKAEKQLAAARAARKNFVGKGRQKVSEEQAAANRATRRERAKRRMMTEGLFPLWIVEEIFEAVAAEEEAEKMSMNSTRFSRLVESVVKRLQSEEAAREAGRSRAAGSDSAAA